MRRGFLKMCVVGGLVVLPVGGLAQELQFSVTPENQPSDTASADTMRLYSGLNQRLADATQEPTSSCLKSYAVYQGCKAGETPATCGVAPSCTVVAPLPAQMDLAGIRFNFPGQDMAVLTPRPPRPPLDMTKIKMIHQDSRPPVAQGSSLRADGAGVLSGGAAAGPPPSAELPKGPVRIAGGVISGVRISAPPPKYPPIAKIAHMSGTVVLRAIISKTGTIEDLEVAAATSPLFVMSSIDAVRHWVYKPYLLNGEPTEVDTTVTVNFTLVDPNKNPSAPTGPGPSQNGPQAFPQLGQPH